MEKGKSLRLTFPRTPPYNNTQDFFTSKALLNRVKICDETGQDRPRESIQLTLLAAKRVFEKTKSDLEQKRTFQRAGRINLQDQWQELRAKGKEFRETVEKMETFIQSNYDKRLRAKQRMEEERAIALERSQNIEKLQKLMQFAEASKLEMEENINELKIYEKFLNRVVALKSEYKNADGLIERYETLVETKKILAEKQNSNMKELEMARINTTKMTEEKRLVILGLSNTLAELMKRYSEAFRNSRRWEQVVREIRNRMYDKNTEIDVAKQSVWNLYILMCRRMGELPKFEETDFENQLLFIKKLLNTLSAIGDLPSDTSETKNMGKKK